MEERRLFIRKSPCIMEIFLVIPILWIELPVRPCTSMIFTIFWPLIPCFLKRLSIMETICHIPPKSTAIIY